MKTTTKQEAFINFYLHSHNVKDSAKKINVSYSTVNRWLENGLKEEIFSRQKAITKSSLLILQNATFQATKTLTEIIKDKTAPPKERIKASEVILNNSIKSLEYTDLLERLERLENEIEKE